MRTPSTAELIAEMNRLALRLDNASDELRAAAVESAEADAAYRLAAAKAYLAAGEGTVSERESRAELVVNKARLTAGIKAGLERAHLESVRNLRQQLSACQSVANAIRSEAELAGKGPNL